MRFFIIFLLIGLPLSGQELNLRKGVVMDSLAVNDSLDQSYSVYLPSSFQQGTLLPVLFIFDSEGRGKSAAQLFKPAAERQGYILVSSNDINPDESLQVNLETGGRLITEVTSRIPLDLEQISVAGLGMGAKVATSIPFLIRDIHGVIAVGEYNLNFELLEDIGEFAFVGIAGEEQIVSYGMQAIVQDLKKRDFPSEFYTFNGGKEWPNPEIVASALGFLSIDAMREGKRAKDTRLVQMLFEQDMRRLNRLVSSEDYILAYDLSDLMLSKYEGLTDLSGVEEIQSQLNNSKNYLSQKAEVKEISEKEAKLIDDYFYYFFQDLATLNFENLGWWNYQVLLLDQYIRSGSEAEAAMAYRLKGLLRKMAGTKTMELEEIEAGLEKKLLAYMLQTIFDQKDYDAYLHIIQLSTRDGDFPTALFYLEELLKNGFSDKEALYNIEGTLGLRLTSEFNWLIDKYLGSSKYYTPNILEE